VRLPWPQRIVPTRWDFAEQTVFEDKNYENLVYLCQYMWEREEQPVLCVCATRETTRRAASELGKRFEATVPTPPETQKAVDLITTKYPHYTHLKRALLSGVAYHNASLPHDLRAAIEDATWHKELRCVVSTTTLAEGIDLPFRVTILADWVRHKGKTQVPYSPLLVRNIAGRCGRVGYFTEGDIVIYDNPLGDRRLKAPGLKEELQQKIFFGKNDEGVHGSIELNFEDVAVQATLAS
jgi:ATP-dependent DNA helicase